jgi:diguanylate cyclase (GGDEF)-like protein
MRGDRSLSSVLDVYRGVAINAAVLIGALLVFCLAALFIGFGRDRSIDVLHAIMALLAAGLLITIRAGYGALRRRVALVDAAKNAVLAAANSDALTGALNRSYFIDQLGQHVHFRARQAVSYLQVDMDNLKVLNDTHGHGAGDIALVHLVRTLRTLMPEAIVGRLGGDEFGVAILGHDNKAALKRIGAELLDRLDQPIHIAGRPVRLSATIGLAVMPQDASDVSDLISKADLALYAGKRAGRRSIVAFEPDMLGDERHRRFVERELRAAILLNELALHYQPILAADGTSVTSYEALVRWQHKVRGMISPADFIGIAEQSDLIDKLGEWVLRRALSDLPRLGAVGVNVSPVQLRRDDFVERFAAILAERGADPRKVTVEITESVPLLAGDVELANLTRLRALGVRIAIDDFGAGHASLYYLRRFAFDVIKIDRTYVANIGESRVDAMIVSAICEIARSLPVEVVAEGVETEDQLTLLKAAGCTGFQGYHLGRPQPLARLVPAVADAA